MNHHRKSSEAWTLIVFSHVKLSVDASPNCSTVCQCVSCYKQTRCKIYGTVISMHFEVSSCMRINWKKQHVLCNSQSVWNNTWQIISGLSWLALWFKKSSTSSLYTNYVKCTNCVNVMGYASDDLIDLCIKIKSCRLANLPVFCTVQYQLVLAQLAMFWRKYMQTKNLDSCLACTMQINSAFALHLCRYKNREEESTSQLWKLQWAHLTKCCRGHLIEKTNI